MKMNRDLLPEGEEEHERRRDPTKHVSLLTKTFKAPQAKTSVSAAVIRTVQPESGRLGNDIEQQGLQVN